MSSDPWVQFTEHNAHKKTPDYTPNIQLDSIHRRHTRVFALYALFERVKDIEHFSNALFRIICELSCYLKFVDETRETKTRTNLI